MVEMRYARPLTDPEGMETNNMTYVCSIFLTSSDTISMHTKMNLGSGKALLNWAIGYSGFTFAYD